MRSFLDILSPPAGSPSSPRRTSSAAIAAVVLDDAGLDPDALMHGVTVIQSSEWWVTDAISSLIIDAVGRDQIIADRFEAISAGRGKVAVFIGQGKVSRLPGG